MNTKLNPSNDEDVSVMETQTGRPNANHSPLARLRLVMAVALGIGLLPVVAHAQSTWTGATDTNWDTADNWSPSGVPANGTALTFGPAINYVVDLGGVTRTVGNTTFTNNYTLNNGTLALGNNILSTSTNSTTTINANLNDGFATISGSGKTILNGVLSGDTYTVAGGSTVVMSGVTTNAHQTTSISGTVIVDKSTYTAQRAALGWGAPNFALAGATLIFTNQLGSALGTLNFTKSGTIIGYSGLFFDGNVQFIQIGRTITLYAPTNGTRFYNWFGFASALTGSAGLETLSDVNFEQNGRGIRDHVGGAAGAQLQFIKSGTGALIYASTVVNSYSGGTRIDAGTLSLSALSQLGTSSDAAANLVLNGGTLRYAGTSAIASSTRGFTVNTGATSGIDVTNAASTVVFTGTHTGTGNLVKRGAGTLELTGDGSGRGGSTIVSNGVLRLASGGTLGSALQVVSGARFDVSNGTSVVGGAVDSDGLISVFNSKVTWQSAVNLSGGYVSDPSTNTFSADLTIAPSGWLAGGVGDLFDFKQSLLVQSTNHSAFNLIQSTVQFSGGTVGTPINHTNAVTGGDFGTNVFAAAGNFGYGELKLGQYDDVYFIGGSHTNGGADANALYVNLLSLENDETNLVANLHSPFNIYYLRSEHQPGNAYLNDLSYQLDGGGWLLPAVPEPSAVLLLLAAGTTLLRRARR